MFACQSRSRIVVVAVSAAIAKFGWLMVLLDFDRIPGIGAIAATASLVLAQTLITPGQSRIYGIGFRDGVAFQQEHADEPQEQPRRLEVVR
jgi:hypothetical protein